MFAKRLKKNLPGYKLNSPEQRAHDALTEAAQDMHELRTVAEAQQKIKDVKMKLHLGMDYRECKREALPALAVLNAEGERIAKKYQRKFRPFTFAGVMR